MAQSFDSVAFLADGDSWLSDNSWLFSLLAVILVVVLIILVILSLVYSKKIFSLLEKSTLKLTAKLAYDSDTMEEYLEISVYNNGLRDVNIKDFGLRYKNQTVSLIGEFTERRASKSRSVDVAVGSSITYKLNPERVERFVVSHNFNAQNIDPIFVVATDSAGHETVTKVKSLSKVFNARQKARILLAKRKIHNEKVQSYKETHEGNVPMSDGIYRAFHKKEIKIPDIIESSQSFMNTDKPHISSDAGRNSSTYSSATNLENGGYSSSSSSEKKTDTRDLKVTYLNLDPLRSTDEDGVDEDESGK